MKILAVRFQNLNSLKGEHVIRFDQSPLADAGLFAITGPTGAGKTTILDAITVGLYGMVHRHNTDKPLDLMTRHTSESTSEVEFEANSKRYRSKWQIRRSRGKANGKIQAVHMELCDLEDDVPFDLKPSQVPDKVAEICGLDYSQFLRSVMLSQGDFARFLKANANERSSLLEKITDTGIYSDISRFAFEKARTERQKRDELARLLQDCRLLPEEERQAYEQSIAELTQQESKLDHEAKTLQEQLHWLQQVQQLQARAQQHQAALQVQEQKLEALQPDFRKLQQHEQARQYEGQLTRIEVADGQLTQVQTQLSSLVNNIPVLEAELESCGHVASTATKTQQQQEEALQQLEPLLVQVSHLDHQINSLTQSFSKHEADFASLKVRLKQDKAQQQATQQAQNILTQEGTRINSWLEQNARLQDLKEHLPEFKATLRDLHEAAQRIRRNQQEQQELQSQLQQEAEQLTGLTQQQAHHQTQEQLFHTQKEEKLSLLQRVLADNNLEELEQTAQTQPAVLATYERLLELAQHYTTQQQKHQLINQELAQHAQQVTETTNQLQEAQTTYKQAEEHLAALQKLVQLQQQIQQYEAARHTLHQGEPCPLCGSEEHPFAENGYSFDLPEEVQKRDRQQAEVKTLEQSINRLQLKLSTLHQKQQLAATAKTETETELERLRHTFEQLLARIPQSIPITETEKLKLLLQEQRKSADTLQQQLAQARALSREVESINQLQQKLHGEQLQAQTRFNQLQQSAKLLQTHLQKLQAILTDEQQQQQANTQTAQSFAATYGLKYKPEERQLLVHTLDQQATAYTQKAQEVVSMREKFAELKSELKSLNERVSEKETELQARRQALKQEEEQLQQLKKERVQLFGQKDPQQERRQARQDLQARAAQAEAARAAHQQKQQELRESRLRRQECEQTHQLNTSVLIELRDGLLHVLQQQGIATIEMLSKMLLQREEADRLAHVKAHTEKLLTQLRRTVADVQQELEQAKTRNLTAESMELLQKSYLEKTQQQRELIGQRARLQQLLELDTTQREKNRELADKLQTQQLVCNRWNQLSDLIGSGDGNKFSRFAQGLTLARLVELANSHLLKLNDRYRILKAPDEDLELTIVDTYQAETVRPMNTLSGGESFLVSLALALGLSDLAGRRTQINSLFIDEGFGTLDAETLDAAISTLENLQAGGKMIGIISHVEALKERIGTQIRIQKIHGGVSKLEIVSL